MKYGIQLYSLRKYLKDEAGYHSVFAKVKEMGADVVQVSSSSAAPVSARVLKEVSEEYGLPICVTHSPFARIVGDTDALCEEHALFGCSQIGVGMMPKQFRENKYARLGEFIDALNTASERMKAYGMTVAYHNHWFEFDRIGGDTVFDRLIADTSPDVRFIPDTFWIKVGGEDPANYLDRMAGRADTLHLKDYKKILGVPVFRALGKGVLDFDSIIDKAEKIGVSCCVAELDFSLDPFKSARTSMRYMDAKRYGK